MKKLYLGLILASVSTVALAQAVSPASKVVEMVKQNVMSIDVEYKAEPTVKEIANGFEVSVPAGVMKTDNRAIDGFSFTATEDGVSGNKKRYVAKLDKLGQVFPTLEKMIKEQKATYSQIAHVIKFVPELEFIESQEISVKDLKVPLDEGVFTSVSSLNFTDTASMLSDTKVKQEDKISLKGINMVHPFASVVIDSFDFVIDVPETFKAKNPLEQLLKTPQVSQKMAVKDIKISVPALGDQGNAGFNLEESLNLKQDGNSKNLTAGLKLDIKDIKAGKNADVPTALTTDMVATGFTLEQLMTFSDTMNKYNEVSNLPDAPRKDVLVSSVQKEVDAASEALMKDLKVTVNNLDVIADNYSISLKGTMIPKDENFKGTLQVSNFEYLAPEPRKIDEAACQNLIDQMLEDKIQGDEFKVKYEQICDEKRGILDPLRAYANTAKKVKDAKGKDALQFGIEISGDDLFINGNKIEDKNVLIGM
ncbi:MAG: hypothetical protein IKQ99_00745 [Alphaproteobacteria bacterium]|nr:hypothetical protein [Alphaproteobacteria bacterium]